MIYVIMVIIVVAVIGLIALSTKAKQVQSQLQSDLSQGVANPIVVNEASSYFVPMQVLSSVVLIGVLIVAVLAYDYIKKTVSLIASRLG